MTFKKGEVTNPRGSKPIRLTADQGAVIVDMASRHRSETTIAYALGVSPDTFTKLKRRDPRVEKWLARGRALDLDDAHDNLRELSRKQALAAIARLNRLDPVVPPVSPVQVNITLPGAVPLDEWRGRIVEGEARRDDDGGDDAEK